MPKGEYQPDQYDKMIEAARREGYIAGLESSCTDVEPEQPREPEPDPDEVRRALCCWDNRMAPDVGWPDVEPLAVAARAWLRSREGAK